MTDRDVAAPLAFFKEARTAGDFEKGIEGGLVAILASPKFLYRAEIPPQNVAAGSMYRLNDLELASRLSFFLWSSIPDNQLLTLAEQGKLKDPAVLEQQVKRMLAAAPGEFAGHQLCVRVAEIARHGDFRSRPHRLSRI